MVVLPKLAETPFDSIRVDLVVANDNLTETLHEELSVSDFKALCCVSDGDRPECLAFDSWYDLGGGEDFQATLTLNFAKEPPAMQWEGGSWVKSDLAAVANALSLFLGHATSLHLEASFSIDRGRVPPHSLVSSMIGLKTSAGEEQFLLSGAQFSVRGIPGDTISWYLPAWEGGKKLSGQVVRESSEGFHSESIADAIYLAQARFNRMVFLLKAM